MQTVSPILHIKKKFSIPTVLFAALVLMFLLPQTALSLYSRETPVVIAVQKISPAVVNISSQYEVRRQNPFSGFGLDPFFDSFFKDFFDPGREQKFKRTSLGSGVIIDGKRGYILTNAHVVAQTGDVTVVLNDEREFPAQIVGADPDSDLAVLRIESSRGLPSAEMGNSDDIMIGETVIAIGNPFGFSNTVTTGVVSALNRSVRAENRVFHDFIQTDASINPGNSGGPLLNINGELIGINTAIYAKAQGIGFAIPINKAGRIIDDLIRYGEVVQAWIGIVVQDLDARLAAYLNLKDNAGAMIQDVESPSPSKDAGVQRGDIIVSLGGKSIRNAEDYYAALKDHAAGNTVSLKIVRNGKPLEIPVTASTFPADRAEEFGYKRLGIKVENLDRSGAGVRISQLDPSSHLSRIGVSAGDVIRRIDEMTINNKKDFEKAMVKYRLKSTLVVLLQRGGNLYHITVNP